MQVTLHKVTSHVCLCAVSLWLSPLHSFWESVPWAIFGHIIHTQIWLQDCKLCFSASREKPTCLDKKRNLPYFQLLGFPDPAALTDSWATQGITFFSPGFIMSCVTLIRSFIQAVLGSILLITMPQERIHTPCQQSSNEIQDVILTLYCCSFCPLLGLQFQSAQRVH